MTISLERADQCLGRSVSGPQDFKGTIIAANGETVWVRDSRSGKTALMIPDDLSWVSGLSPELANAIVENDYLDGVQVGYAPEVFDDPYNGHSLAGFGVVFSGAISNDDGERHPLYAVAHTMRRVHLLRINANPDIAREIEELLGWANP